MMRKAFVIEVLPDKHREYCDRHQAVWPELEQVFKAHGVHDYSLFLNRQTSQLFGYLVVEDEARWAAIGGTEVYARWWDFMRDIVVAGPDGGPLVVGLDEVYHLD